MSDLQINFQPGCFGSALAYCVDAIECKTCAFTNDCEVQATVRRAKLIELLGAGSVARSAPSRRRAAVRPERTEPATPAPAPPVASDPAEPAAGPLPTKVIALVQGLGRAGIKLADGLRAGVNPCAERSAFLRLACAALLQGGFTRSELRQAYVRELDWAEQTAASHVGQVVALITHLGAATEVDGRFQIAR